jgi:hypothetical protein
VDLADDGEIDRGANMADFEPSLRAFPSLPIVETMERVVRRVGGSLVSDRLPSRVNPPPNADYVFPQHGVIAELKRLEKNQSENRELTEKIGALYRGWTKQGKVPPIYGRAQVNVPQLPKECAYQIISLYKKPIQHRIKEANDQIKSTKKLLDMKDAIGLLFLAQDGDYSIGPGALFSFVSRCLTGGIYSSIDDVICINAMPAARNRDPRRYMFWLHASRDVAGKVPKDLLRALQNAWGVELEKITGGPLPLIRPTSQMDLDTIYFPKGLRKP